MNKALQSTASTPRSLIRPSYARAETYDAWIQINAELVTNYWRDLAIANGKDPDRLAYADLRDFSHTEYESVSRRISEKQP